MSKQKSNTSAKAKPAKPVAAKQSKPVKPAIVFDNKSLTGDGKHIAVHAPISGARRALHELESKCNAALRRGPVDIDKLAEMMLADYGVTRGALDRQLDFELRVAKAPRFKRVGKNGSSLAYIDTASAVPGFRKQHATAKKS